MPVGVSAIFGFTFGFGLLFFKEDDGVSPTFCWWVILLPGSLSQVTLVLNILILEFEI